MLTPGKIPNKSHSLDEDNFDLLSAAKNGQFDICKLLVEKKADLNDPKKLSPLSFACRNGHYNIAKLFLENGAHPQGSLADKKLFPLAAAVAHHCKEYTEIVELLLKHKADINQTNDLGYTALVHAAQWGNIKMVEHLLLVEGVDVNKSTPVLEAARMGYLEIIKILHKHGANLHQIELTPDEFRQDVGETALMFAAMRGRLDILEYLLTQKADINQVTNQGATALFFAAADEHIEAVKFLLAKGADPSICANDKISPLHAALRYGNHDIAMLLLRDGITKTAKELKSIGNAKHRFNILLSAQQVSESPLPEFKQLEKMNITPIYFDENGRQVIEPDEKKVSHVLLRDCNYSDIFKFLQVENSLKYRFVLDIEITKTKPLFKDSFEFEISVELLRMLTEKRIIDFRIRIETPTVQMKIKL